MTVASRLGIETQDSEDERILLNAVKRATAPKAAAAPAVPETPEKKEPSYKGSLTAGKEALGAAGSKIKGAFTGAEVGTVAERGFAAGEGVAELGGALFAPIQQLIHNVVAAQGGDAEMPKDVARVFNAALHLFSLPKQVVKEILAGSPEAQAALRAEREKQTEEALERPLSWAEGLSFLGATATGGKMVTKQRGAAAEKPLTAKQVKAAAGKAAFEKALSEAGAKDVKAAEARAARRAAEQAVFDATRNTPKTEIVSDTASVVPDAAMPADVPTTLYRHGKPQGEFSNFGESAGMVSPFRDAGPLYSLELTAAQAEKYRKSTILKDPNADPLIKAEIEKQGGLVDREFLVSADDAKGAKEVYADRPEKGLEMPIKPDEVVAKTEGMPGDKAEAQINAELGIAPSEVVIKPAAAELQPVRPEPIVEPAAEVKPVPQIQNLSEAHAIAESVTSDALSFEPSSRMAWEFVKALRTSTGFSREQLRAQGSEVIKFLEKEATKGDMELAEIQAEATRISARLAEIEAQLGDTPGTLSADLAGALARRVTAALLDLDPLKGEDPAAWGVKALTDVGVSKKRASGIVEGILDAYEQSGLSGEEGAFYPGLFWGKDANKTQPVFDVKAAEVKLGERARAAGLRGPLRLDSKKLPTDEQMVAIAAARDTSTTAMNATLRRVKEGAKLEPGDLFDSATLAGAAADKARVVEGRWGKEADPSRQHGGHAPIREKELARFADYLQREMTEPELYAKLQTLEPYQQQQWLANLYRASSVKGLSGGYMAAYVMAKLSGPYTLARATIGDLIMLPMDLSSHALGAQIGKLLPGDAHILPGEAAIRAKAMWQAFSEQATLFARRDWDGIKTQMVTEGEWNPIVSNPTNLISNVVNATAGWPAYALGAERASTRIINRHVELVTQAHLQALREYPNDQAAYAKSVEFYKRNPTAEMMKLADEHADAQAFTKRFGPDDPMGMLQDAGRSNIVKVLVSPFPRIDVGILDMTLQGTPGLNFLSKTWRDAVAEGGRARDKAIGRTATGTLVIGVGMAAAMQGLVTGDGPSDPAQRKVWELAGGRPNTIYSPFTGKPLVSHASLGPISGWLAMGSDLSFMLRHASEQSGRQLVTGALQALGEPITHAGYLNAWSEVFGMIKSGLADNDWLRYMRRKIADISLSKPALVTFIDQQTTPEGRPDLATPRGDLIDREWKLLKDEITSGWPGWSKGFPTFKNFLTYEAIPRDGLAPWNKEVTKDVVAIELNRLGNKVGGQFTIFSPPDHIGGEAPAEGLADDKPTQGVRLEAWEKDRLLQIMATEIEVKGRTLHAAMLAEMKSDRYASAETDEKRALYLFGLYTAFKVGAQAKLLQEDPYLKWLVVQQKIEQAAALGVVKDNPLGPKPAPTKYPRPSQTR